jgi:hypothetical protein
MEEWFRSEKNKRNVLGKNLSEGALKVKKDGGDVDAITAATISSRAFLDAVNRAYAAFSGKGYSDAVSGATWQSPAETPPTPNAAPAGTEPAEPAETPPLKSNQTDSIQEKPPVPLHIADEKPEIPDTVKKTAPETKETEEAESQTPRQELIQHFHLGNETIPAARKEIEAAVKEIEATVKEIDTDTTTLK